MNVHAVNADEEMPRWSVGSILFWATFGTKTPAERRFISRSSIAGGIVAGWALLDFIVGFRPKPAMFLITALLPGPAFTYMVWEWRKYVLTLDELARRMQFEAATWTYATGLVLAMWLGGVAAVVHWPGYLAPLGPRITVSITLFLFGLLEIVRSLYLYRLSRRY